MGLDICLRKPYKPDKADENHKYFVIEDNPELEIFKDLFVEKTNDYCDVPQAIKDANFEEEDLEWMSTAYLKEGCKYEFFNKKHELYPIYQILQNLWHKSYKNSLFQLKNSEEWKEFNSSCRNLLLSNGWEESYKFKLARTKSNKRHVYNLVNAYRFCKDKIKVVLWPKIISKVDLCLAYKEIGYQRKGANKKFYEDNMWEGPTVVSLKTLLEHKEKYFDEEFQTNIVDKFVEGETFVVYC